MQWYNNDRGSRLCLLYILRTRLGGKRRGEKRSIFARASAILFTVDITHSVEIKPEQFLVDTYSCKSDLRFAYLQFCDDHYWLV